MVRTATRTAPETPTYFPRTTAVLEIGLETIVRIVLFSISRAMAEVARNAASSIPHTKTVDNPMSSKSLLSPETSAPVVEPIEKPACHVFRYCMNPQSMTRTKVTGCRRHSMSVTRAMVRI